MKYSYMPTKEYYGKSKAEPYQKDGLGYAVESDERMMLFRNQYGQEFAFIPFNFILWLNSFLFIAGFVIGKVL